MKIHSHLGLVLLLSAFFKLGAQSSSKNQVSLSRSDQFYDTTKWKAVCTDSTKKKSFRNMLANTKLSPLNSHLLTKGIGGLEFYHTSFQNPRMLNQPTYLRLNSALSINCYGLPFIMDAYYSSEKRTFYNSNHLTFRFDKAAFMQTLTSTWQTKINGANESYNKHRNELRGLSGTQVTLDRQKLQLEKQEELLKKQMANEKEKYLHNYSSVPDSSQFQLPNDSLGTSYPGVGEKRKQWEQNHKNQIRDSLHIEKLVRDTQEIHDKLEALRNKYDDLKEKQGQFDSALSADTAIIGKYKRMVSNPERYAETWLKDNGFPPQLAWAMKLKDLQTGNVQPYYNEYSLAGVGFRGLSTGINLGKWEVNLAGGKGIPMDAMNYDRSNNNYTRNYVAGAFVYRISDITSLTLFTHHIADPMDKMTRLGKTALLNNTVGVNIKTPMVAKILLDASLATCAYRVLNHKVVQVNYTGSQTISDATIQKAKSAMHLNLSRKLSKNFDLSGSYQYVGPLFKNLGNPYMRTNFLEYSGKLNSFLLKGQIKIGTFYKAIQDNPLKLSENTNWTKGYGINMQTRFHNRKLPNFNFGISPYEQGNNHPDSLFRVNNRFSVISGGANYQAGYKVIKYSLLIYATRSIMQFNDSFRGRIETMTVNQDFGLGKYFSAGFAGTIMRTQPGVDSNQANILQGRIGYVGKKRLSISTTVQWSQYLNGAYRKGISINIGLRSANQLRISLRAGYDRFYRLWGLSDQNSYWGLVRCDFQL